MNEVVYQQVNKDHAYWSEKRALGQLVGGNTAGLLTHWQHGHVVTAILFDAGLGTINGLSDLVSFDWTWPLTVFVTHGHPDHHLELTIISELWCKRYPQARRGPLAVHCTPTTYTDWLEPVHRWGFTGGKTLDLRPLTPKEPVQVGIFTVHAVAVDHCAGAVIYVVEFGEGHRILIGWDMKTLPDPQAMFVLKNPSLALLEANTWNALSARTGHTSVVELIETGFLAKLNAPLGPNHYGSFLVHYSGQEDPEGMLSDHELDARLKATYPIIADHLRVAARGQTWRFSL